MDITFTSTSTAKEEAEKLINYANNFDSIIGSLEFMRYEIAKNWEGDTTDVASIQEKITTVATYYREKIIPAMLKLGNGTIAFASAVDQVSKRVVESAKGMFGSNGTSSSNGTSLSEKTIGKYEEAKEAKATVGAGSAMPSGTTTTAESDTSSYTYSDRKWGEWNTFDGDYWSSVGQDFSDNWDYSSCDSGIDYVLETVGGAGSTVIDAAETVLEVGVDLVGSAASSVINGIEEAWNWFF